MENFQTTGDSTIRLATDLGIAYRHQTMWKSTCIAVLFVHLLTTAALADAQGPARVVDGDTLEIAGRKIRLLDMDAPEGKQRCADAAGQLYRCGDVATAYLRELIGSRPVRCEGSKRDRYRCLLAICYVGNIDLGREMVRAGQ